jgi:hypothetical protein
MIMKMAVPCDAAVCLVDTDLSFRGAYCINLKMEAVRSFEMLVNIYQTSRYYISEDSHLSA